MQTDWNPKAYKDYTWIVKDDALLGGKLAVRGTRLSVAHLLECLSQEWTQEEIDDAFGTIPKEAMNEVLKVAAELAGNPHVAA